MYSFLNKKILFLNSLTFLLVLVYSFIFLDIVYLITFISLYILYFCYILYKKSYNILFIFSILLPFYMIFSFLIAFNYHITMNVPYGYADESLFYYLSLENFPELVPKDFIIVNKMITYMDLIDFPGYYTLLKYLGNIFDFVGEESFFALKLISTFAGVGSILLLFEIAKKFFSIKDAIVISIFFSLSPIIIFHSSVLMRDILILFLTLIVVLTLLNITSKNNIQLYIFLLLILAILFSFRPENGLFMFSTSIIFLIYYNLKKNIKNIYVRMFFYFFIFLISYILMYDILSGVYEKFLLTMDSYVNRGLNSSEGSASSLGAKLLALSPPLRLVARLFVSQMSPFPFWANFDTMYLMLEGIGGFLLFLMWPFIFIALIKERIRNKIDKRLLFFFIIFFVYLVLTSYIQPLQRKLMISYPIFILIAFYGYKYSSIRERNLLVYFALLCLFILYCMYLYLKV